MRKMNLRDIQRIIYLGDTIKELHKYGVNGQEMIGVLLQWNIITIDESEKLKSYIVGSFCID